MFFNSYIRSHRSHYWETDGNDVKGNEVWRAMTYNELRWLKQCWIWVMDTIFSLLECFWTTALKIPVQCCSDFMWFENGFTSKLRCAEYRVHLKMRGALQWRQSITNVLLANYVAAMGAIDCKIGLSLLNCPELVELHRQKRWKCCTMWDTTEF